jgi:hypothetical protein
MCASSTSTSQRFPPKTARVLPAGYKPDRCTVVVGKGNLAAQALGNSALRDLVQSHVKAYSMAKNKRSKTKIVGDILEEVKEWNTDRVGFVKYYQGRWYESSDPGACDIITARFRDALSDQYLSSSRHKVAKRRNHKAFCRAMKATAEFELPTSTVTTPSSTASVVSTDEAITCYDWYQMTEHIEPLPLSAPEPFLSSSYIQLEDFFQSAERVPVAPKMAASSLFFREVAMPTMVMWTDEDSLFLNQSNTHNISDAVKTVLKAEDDVIPLETVLDGELCEYGEVMQSWAADVLS